MCTCASCSKSIGAAGNAIYTSSTLGLDVFCYECFLQAHKNGHKRTRHQRYNATKEIIMKSLQVSVSFTVESEDDAKNVFAMLGALQKSGSTLAAAKPAAALASEPAPASKSKATKPKSAPEPVEEEEEDAEEEDAEEEEEEEEAPPAKSKIKVTDELRNATKLREVLSVLIDAGINSKKGLLKECLALKAKIPVLQRVQDLETRIPKAAELIKPDIGA